MTDTILSYPGDYKAMKGLIAAAYAGVEVTTPKKGEFEMGVHNKTPAFLAKSPLGKVPVLERADGTLLLEGNAIARYYARVRSDKQLLCVSFLEQAKVDQWVDWCQNELEVAATMWLFPIWGLLPYNPKATNKAQQDMKAILKVLNAELADKSYLVGESITLADICLTAALYYPMKLLFDYKFRAAYPHIVRYFLTCASLPEFAKILGPLNLCVEAQKAKAPAKKQKAKKKNKSESKAAKPKPKPKPKKRAKHPLDALPRAKVDIDTWKRKYSNSKRNYYLAFDWLKENLDLTADYSLWLCNFKYQEENQEDFKVSNRIGGFIQRCEEVRKWTFGTMVILDAAGFEGKYWPVHGAWLTRGQDIKYLVDSNPDATIYDWVKVDPSDAAQMQKVADCWCSMEPMESFGKGVVMYDGKVFK